MLVAASWVRGAGNWDSALFDAFVRRTVLPASQSSNPNNHGAWGVLLEASAAAYLGDTVALNAARRRWETLLEGAIAPDGTLTREITRSGTSNWNGGPDKGVRGLAYTHYFIMPASVAAKIFARQGQPVWGTKAGKLFGLAFDRAAAWTLHPETFPYYTSNGGHLGDVRNGAYFALLRHEYPSVAADSVLSQGNVGANSFMLLELFGESGGPR